MVIMFCFQICQMKKDSKCVKRTVLKSMVGTLDLHIRYLFDGETFPGVYSILFKN